MIDEYFKLLKKHYGDILTGVSVGMLFVYCVGTVFLLAFLGWKKGAKWSAGLLLLEYLVLLLILSVWARSGMAERKYDFTPFWSYRAVREGNVHLLTQIIANVFAFIPIGLLLGCASGRMKWWKVLLIGGGFSVLIETLQFFLKRGFAEFDDVFHNVLGCMIGYGIYLAGAWVIKKYNKVSNRPLRV